MNVIVKLKLWVHIVARCAGDALSGRRFCRRASCAEPRVAVDEISVTQPFTASATLENKKHNLRLAASRIEPFLIRPGETFSFWRAVGSPNTPDWESSRSIKGGVLQLERGGGICQISGIIHHLALIAGLEITERHSHSKDLYTEQTRFCPLGSDATVAYGYKDLRFKNNTDCSLWLTFLVGESHFTATLHSSGRLTHNDIEFRRSDNADGTLTAVAVNAATGEVVAESRYERLEHGS